MQTTNNKGYLIESIDMLFVCKIENATPTYCYGED